MDTLTMRIQVEGVKAPVTATFGFEPPDYSVGINGGWFLAEAVIGLPPGTISGCNRTILLDADDFEHLFGREALNIAEQNCADHYTGLREDAELEKAEVGA